MKKLLILTFALLVGVSVFGRPRVHPREVDERVTDWIIEQLKEAGYTVLPEVIVQDTLNRSKKSNYEKYWEEKNGSLEKPKPGPRPEFDDLYFQPNKDGKNIQHKPKKDTIEKKQIIVNNYYDNDFYYRNRLRPFFYPSFYFSWNYHTPYYYMWNEPFFYDWYYPYYGWNTPRYSWNYWWGWDYPIYYTHYNYNFYSYNHSYNIKQPVQYGRRERPSTLTQTPITNRRVVQPQAQQRSTVQPQRQVRPPVQSMPKYSEGRRSYTPSYEAPRMNVRPQYNNSRIGNRGSMERREIGNPNTDMPKSTRITPPQSNRTYSAPSANRSYSTPPQNFNSGNDMSRRSSSSSFSNGGGNVRSSSGSSSSGTTNNSGRSSTGRR